MTDIQAGRATPVARPRVRYLVGPEFFPLYELMLKVVVAAVVGGCLVGGVARAILAGGALAGAIAPTLAMMWNGACVGVGVVTMLFAVLERSPVAGRNVLAAWDRVDLTWPTRRRRTTWVHRMAAIAVLAVFLLGWTQATRALHVPLSAGRSVDLGLAPVWLALHWPVFGLALGAIAVNALRLIPATNRRLGRGLDLALQLAVAGVAVAALGADRWVVVSGGLSAHALAYVGRGVNIGAEVGLVAIVCAAVIGAAHSLWRMFRGEAEAG